MRSPTETVSSENLWQKIRNFRIIQPKDGYSQELVFLGIFASSVFLYLSLVSFSPFDPSPYNYSFPPRLAKNLCGALGANLAGFLIYQLGALAGFLPIPCLWMSFQNIRGHADAFRKTNIFAAFLFTLCLMMAGHHWAPELSFETIHYLPAGALGYYLHESLQGMVGIAGFYVLMATGVLFTLLMVRREPVLKPMYLRTHELIKKLRFRKANKAEKAETVHVIPTLPVNHPPILGKEPTPDACPFSSLLPKSAAKPEAPIMPSHISPNPPPSDGPLFEHLGGEDLSMQGDFEQADLIGPDAAYQAPSATMFRVSPNQSEMSEEQKREFEQTAESLVKSFSEFGIGGEVIAIQPGPVVTVYEFQPHAGTKLAKVTGLVDDIALALKVDSIFIHPVSGKRALGVQVPNKKRETVFLGDLVQNNVFKDMASPLTFALGKALNGEPVCCDLASMPHLLTAGQTGAGKSVAINALLCSLILKSSPEQVRLILVDPKILELKIYEGIPHLLMPVITEPLKASLALKWACQEMDRRYQLMETASVRHISGFNQFWDNASQATRESLKDRFLNSDIGKLPYIVIVIDELADLMLTASKDVENSIQRLAQKARASGIHLVLATQRPSVDVITGVIKANLPCRIAFKVFSRIDSRTILDSMGAERLLGKGDMLFLRPGSTKLERIQGAFLADEEVLAMVGDIKKTSTVDYDASAMEWIDEEYQRQASPQSESGADSPGQADPKWNEAIGIAQRQGAISASYLQRMLKIGYNRAARMVEAMEAQGLVAKADGSKPRAWIGG